MRAAFVRDGHSTDYAGLPSPYLSSIALTELGHAQARAVAAAWIETLALIVTSRYLRTAAPTIARFPDVAVEVWPIEEFTYLQPAGDSAVGSPGEVALLAGEIPVILKAHPIDRVVTTLTSKLLAEPRVIEAGGSV